MVLPVFTCMTVPDCAKAQEAVRLFNSRKNQDGSASVEWYQCATKVQGRDYITGACFMQGGSVEKPAPGVDSGADPHALGYVDFR